MVAAARCSRLGPAQPEPPVPRQGEEFGRFVAFASICIGIILAAAKIWVGIHAGSASVVSDGLEAAGDALSSTFVFIGLLVASKPPDTDHPYGHGRYETLAGLGVGAILLLAGSGIFFHTATHFERSTLEPYALYPLLAAVVIKLCLAAVKFRSGNRIGSTAMKADAWHDVTDLLSTFVALVCVGLTLLNPVRFGYADHVGGLAIGIIIFFLSAQVVRNTIDQLVDRMPEAARMEQIRSVALSVPGALGIEKCFARRTGLRFHVDLHLEVDPDMTVRESHDIASEVKGRIKEQLAWVENVLVHVEPSGMTPTEATPRHYASRTGGSP